MVPLLSRDLGGWFPPRKLLPSLAGAHRGYQMGRQEPSSPLQGQRGACVLVSRRVCSCLRMCVLLSQRACGRGCGFLPVGLVQGKGSVGNLWGGCCFPPALSFAAQFQHWVMQNESVIESCFRCTELCWGRAPRWCPSIVRRSAPSPLASIPPAPASPVQPCIPKLRSSGLPLA